MMYGITFDDKHTYKDFGLSCVSVDVGMPPVKKKRIDLKGADGVLDLTNIFGRTLFNNRKLTFKFDHEEKNYRVWASHLSAVANFLHGRSRKVILDNDPNYYYEGRITVKGTKSNKPFSLLTVEIDAAPYKRELRDAKDYCWNWDTFSFLDGVIREYYDLIVDGSYVLTMIGSEMPVTPVFLCSSAMLLEFDGNTYELEAGENKIYEIVIGEGAYNLTFTGNGIVSVSYRGGRI